MPQSENVRRVAEQILEAFQAGTVPAACAQIFLRHTPDDSRPCARWSWRNQLLAALLGHETPHHQILVSILLGRYSGKGMVNCWAYGLGGCSTKQSKEHPFSRRLLGKRPVTVHGLPWCQEPKTVPVQGFGSNILCTHHNSNLSALDLAGTDAFLCFQQFCQVRGVRTKERLRQARVQHYRVDGSKLERWCLKVLIGTAFGQRSPKQDAWKPPLEWVEIVFGKRLFSAHCGLYIGDFKSATLELETNTTKIDMLTRGEDGDIDGAVFSLNGWRMALALIPMRASDLRYRPTLIRDLAGLKLQQVIRFDWQQASAEASHPITGITGQ